MPSKNSGSVPATDSQCKKPIYVANPNPVTLQVKGRWESKINVWFRFMYSQKWNCLALLFPKQNYRVMFCLPNSTFMYLWVIYICKGSVCLFGCKRGRPILEYINHSQERGRTVSCLGIHKSDFRYSTGPSAQPKRQKKAMDMSVMKSNSKVKKL